MANKTKNEAVDAVEVVETNELQKLMIRKLYEDYVSDIANSMEEIVNNYLLIGHALKEIKFKKLYELEGYKNIFELAKAKFNLGETSTKNFMNVYSKFGDSKNIGYLKNDYEKYSFSQLVELLPVSEDEVKNYSPTMSVQEMKQIKKESQTTDDIKKYTKEFSKMVDNVKEAVIKGMGIEEELKSCKIDIKYDERNSECCSTIKIESENYSDTLTFRLSIDRLKFVYFIDSSRNYYLYGKSTSFLEFMDKIRNCVAKYKKSKDDAKKAELERKLANEKELEEFANSNLKTDSERELFVTDPNNWSIIKEIPLGNCSLIVSTFNVAPSFIKINILDYEDILYVENIAKDDEVEELYCESSGEWDIARYLYKIKY